VAGLDPNLLAGVPMLLPADPLMSTSPSMLYLVLTLSCLTLGLRLVSLPMLLVYLLRTGYRLEPSKVLPRTGDTSGCLAAVKDLSELYKFLPPYGEEPCGLALIELSCLEFL